MSTSVELTFTAKVGPKFRPSMPNEATGLVAGYKEMDTEMPVVGRDTIVSLIPVQESQR